MLLFVQEQQYLKCIAAIVFLVLMSHDPNVEIKSCQGACWMFAWQQVLPEVLIVLVA